MKTGVCSYFEWLRSCNGKSKPPAYLKTISRKTDRFVVPKVLREYLGGISVIK